MIINKKKQEKMFIEYSMIINEIHKKIKQGRGIENEELSEESCSIKKSNTENQYKKSEY